MLKYFCASITTFFIMLGLTFGVVVGAMTLLEFTNISIALGLTVVFNLTLFLIGPYVTDFILKYVNGIQWWSPEELQREKPELYDFMLEICQKYSFDMPHFGIIPDDNPTAFTYGVLRNNARIVMTAGIFKYLNDNQAKAVLAHELGHVKHYDFALLTAANILVQVLFQVYSMLRRPSKSARKKGGGRIYVALIAYGAYVIANYLLLYLSRSREYLADKFAAQHTNSADLAGALIRIAYGIMNADDDKNTHKLLQQTRTMGIIDVNNAKYAGLLVKNTTMDADKVSEAMLFDCYNPWAFFVELCSTHPLTGKRLKYLNHLSQSLGQNFPDINPEKAAKRINLSKLKLYSNFCADMAVNLMPALITSAIAGLYYFNYINTTYHIIPIVFFISSFFLVFYRMPLNKPEPITTIELLCNPYASPVRGRAVILEGNAVGRLTPGSFMDEDMLFQDKQGFIPLNFQSWFGFIGNLMVGISKIRKVLGQPAQASGWYFRGNGGFITLNSFSTSTVQLLARPYLGTFILHLIPTGLFVYALFDG